MSRGILLRGGEDETIVGRAGKLKVMRTDDLSVPFDKTLLVEAGTRVPWDLLPAAWHFLDKWDAAVPLWRYGETAADAGTPEERAATAAMIHDLRVLLHSVELLFVRQNEPGCALVEAWAAELDRGPDQRLAFLRALYQVKPRLCVLPTTWLAEVRKSSSWARKQRSPNAGQPLVLVELEPGRFVKVHKGDEERVREHFKHQRGG